LQIAVDGPSLVVVNPHPTQDKLSHGAVDINEEGGMGSASKLQIITDLDEPEIEQNGKILLF